MPTPRKSIDELKLAGNYRPQRHDTRETPVNQGQNASSLKKDIRTLKERIAQLEKNIERDGLILTAPNGRQYANPAVAMLRVDLRELRRLEAIVPEVKPRTEQQRKAAFLATLPR